MEQTKRLRMGVWFRMEIPSQGSFVGYTYLDHSAGFSAQGTMLKNEQLSDGGHVIVRLPLSEEAPWRELTTEELTRYGLEAHPRWVQEHYGEQPTSGTEWGLWQTHPKLRGKFHPEYPDDLQILVHDGGIRFSQSPPELLWVRTVGMDADVFRGQVLNQPESLRLVRQGETVQFIVPEVGPHPILARPKYLAERKDWNISPCQRCGMTELFDAPSDLMKKIFPEFQQQMQGTEEELMAFTVFCSICDGVHIVERKGATDRSLVMPAFQVLRKKPWWKFWG
jgi:Uncharacterized protein conserved in bacteria (DUF2314)